MATKNFHQISLFYLRAEISIPQGKVGVFSLKIQNAKSPSNIGL